MKPPPIDGLVLGGLITPKAHILGLAMDLSDDDPFRIRSMIRGAEPFPTEGNHKPSSTRGFDKVDQLVEIGCAQFAGNTGPVLTAAVKTITHIPKQRPAMFVVVRPQEVQLLVGECHGPTTHNHRVCYGLFLPCSQLFRPAEHSVTHVCCCQPRKLGCCWKEGKQIAITTSTWLALSCTGILAALGRVLMEKCWTLKGSPRTCRSR